MKILGHRNAECIKCDVVLLHMIRVGALVMCPPCFEAEFKTDDPVRKERTKYLHWLSVYNTKIEKELEME